MLGALGMAMLVLQSPANKNEVVLTEYVSPTEGYRINYPAVWYNGDLDKGKISKTKNGVFIGSLTIAAKIKAGKEFRDYIEQDLKSKIRQASSKYQIFEILAEKYSTSEGKRIFYMEAISEQETATHADHTVILYVDRGNGQLAGVVMGVNQDEWQKNPLGYKKVVESFSLR